VPSGPQGCYRAAEASWPGSLTVIGREHEHRIFVFEMHRPCPCMLPYSVHCLSCWCSARCRLQRFTRQCGKRPAARAPRRKLARWDTSEAERWHVGWTPAQVCGGRAAPRSVARTLFSCRCAGGMTAEQEHEDSRLVAIHRLVAVRRFAQGDAEPCQVLEGLFVGARAAPAPGAAHWPLGGCCAVQVLSESTAIAPPAAADCAWTDEPGCAVDRVLPCSLAVLQRTAPGACGCAPAAQLLLGGCCASLVAPVMKASTRTARWRTLAQRGTPREKAVVTTCTCLGRAAGQSTARPMIRTQGAAARSAGCVSPPLTWTRARNAPARARARAGSRRTAGRGLNAAAARRGRLHRRGAEPGRAARARRHPRGQRLAARSLLPQARAAALPGSCRLCHHGSFIMPHYGYVAPFGTTACAARTWLRPAAYCPLRLLLRAARIAPGPWWQRSSPRGVATLCQRWQAPERERWQSPRRERWQSP